MDSVLVVLVVFVCVLVRDATKIFMWNQTQRRLQRPKSIGVPTYTHALKSGKKRERETRDCVCVGVRLRDTDATRDF